MTRSVTFRPEADADLGAIYDYISRDSPGNAAGFSARLRAFCEGFAQFGERGTLREDLGPGLRIVGFERRAVIAFRVLTDRVQIVRIFYRGQDFERLLGKE